MKKEKTFFYRFVKVLLKVLRISFTPFKNKIITKIDFVDTIYYLFITMTINGNFYFHHLVFKCPISKEMWDKKVLTISSLQVFALLRTHECLITKYLNNLSDIYKFFYHEILSKR